MQSGHIAIRSFVMTHFLLNCPSGGFQSFAREGRDDAKTSDLTFFWGTLPVQHMKLRFFCRGRVGGEHFWVQASTALWLVGACWRNFDSRSRRTVASGHIAARNFMMTHYFLNCPSGGFKVFVQGHDGDKISDLTFDFLVAVSVKHMMWLFLRTHLWVQASTAFWLFG